MPTAKLALAPALRAAGLPALVATALACAPEDVIPRRVVPAPGGDRVAQLYTVSGGGAAGYVYDVPEVRPASAPPMQDGHQAFVFAYADSVDVRWVGDRRLVVTYPAGTTVSLQKRSMEGVEISYELQAAPAARAPSTSGAPAP